MSEALAKMKDEAVVTANQDGVFSEDTEDTLKDMYLSFRLGD